MIKKLLTGIVFSIAVIAVARANAPVPPLPIGFACSSTGNPNTGWGPLCETQWNNQMAANLANFVIGLGHCWTNVTIDGISVRQWSFDHNGNLAYTINGNFSGNNPLDASYYNKPGQSGTCSADVPRTDGLGDQPSFAWTGYLPSGIDFEPIGIAASLICPTTSTAVQGSNPLQCVCPVTLDVWQGSVGGSNGYGPLYGYGNCGPKQLEAVNTWYAFDPVCIANGYVYNPNTGAAENGFMGDLQIVFAAPGPTTQIVVRSQQFFPDGDSQILTNNFNVLPPPSGHVSWGTVMQWGLSPYQSYAYAVWSVPTTPGQIYYVSLNGIGGSDPSCSPGEQMTYQAAICNSTNINLDTCGIGPAAIPATINGKEVFF